MEKEPQCKISFTEVKSDQYLGTVAGQLLSMANIREVHKRRDNQALIVAVTSHDEVNYAAVEGILSGVGHTITR